MGRVRDGALGVEGRAERRAGGGVIRAGQGGEREVEGRGSRRGVHRNEPGVGVSAGEGAGGRGGGGEHGALGFIPKSADSDTIGHALGTILDGETWAPPEAHNVPPTGSEEREVGQRLRELTPQQFRVLQMLGAGRLNKQIAYDLNVSEATIKAHVTAILRKLGVTNRTQAVLMAGKLAIDDDAIVLPPEED